MKSGKNTPSKSSVEISDEQKALLNFAMELKAIYLRIRSEGYDLGSNGELIPRNNEANKQSTEQNTQSD